MILQPSIRSWRPDDQPAVWRLYAEGRMLVHDVPGEEAHDLRNLVQTYFQHHTSHFWVAEASGRVVGMIGMAQNERHAVEIRRLRVEASYRHSELSSRLLGVAIDHCRRNNVLKVVLNTALARETALTLLGHRSLIYTRQRLVRGKPVMEFYVNLYQSRLEDASGEAPPPSAPDPLADRSPQA